MTCYVQPYEGDKPYLFLSYCHKDAADAFTLIERLTVDGYRVWFDDGLHLGNDEWRRIVAEHLYKSAVCVIMVSSGYAQSSNWINELTLAINLNKPAVSVILEKFNMTLGMTMQLRRSVSINCYEFAVSPEEFYSKLEGAPALAQCRNENVRIDQCALEEWKNHMEEYQRISNEKSKTAGLIDIWDASLRSERSKKNTVKQGKEIKRENEKTEHDPKENTESNESYEKDKYGKNEDDPYDDTIDKKPLKEPEQDDEPTRAERKKPVPTKAILIYLKTGELYKIKGDEISLGRNKKQADFVVGVGNDLISRHHADIISVDDKYYLKDNDSKNGTFLHGRRLDEQPAELSSFDEFLFAEEEDEKFIFASGQSMKLIRETASQGFFATLTAKETGELRVIGKEGIFLDRKHPWKEGILDDMHISKEHVQIAMEEDGFIVQDRNSKNGTTVNDETLTPFEKQKLNNGDNIKIVDTPFIFSLYIVKTGKAEVQE